MYIICKEINTHILGLLKNFLLVGTHGPPSTEPLFREDLLSQGLVWWNLPRPLTAIFTDTLARCRAWTRVFLKHSAGVTGGVMGTLGEKHCSKTEVLKVWSGDFWGFLRPPGTP